MKKKLLLTSILTLSLAIGVGAVAFSSDNKKVTNAADTQYEGGVTYLSSVENKVIDTHDDTESEIKSYYNDLNDLSASERRGQNLLKHLKPILQNGSRFVNYDNIRYWYLITERDWIQSPLENPGSIFDYSASTSIKAHVLYRNTNGETNAADYDTSFSDLNREHLWVKSRGFEEKYQTTASGTDIHHLILADNRINSTSHNNYPYGDAETPTISPTTKQTDSYNDGTSIGYRYRDTANQLWFEPMDSEKGDIARAIFYMAARYNNLAGDSMVETTKSGKTVLLSEANLKLNNWDKNNYSRETVESLSDTAIEYGDLATLIRWHKMDPVSDFEIHRNNLIDNNCQHNRNPFIDYPEWVDYIWGNGEGYAQPNSDTISQYGHTCMEITGSNTIVLGETETYDVDITGITGNNTILWSTSNESVATISSTGVVTPVSEGTVTIKAITKDSTFYAEKEIEVTESAVVHVTGVELNKDSLSLAKDDTYKLTTTVSPNNADDNTVTWLSSDTSVATVNNGVITAAAPGTTTITVTTHDGGLTDTCAVTVSAKPVAVDDQYQLSFGKSSSESSALTTSNFLTNSNINYNDLVNSITATSKCYKSYEGLKIGVSGEAGSFTAATGKANIKTIRINSEKYGNDTGKLKLYINGNLISDSITPGSDYSHTFDTRTTINNIQIETTAKRTYLHSIIFETETPVSGVTLDRNTLALTEGESDTLVATVAPNNAANKNVSWISSDPTVATVDANGLVEALKEGETTITVTTQDGGYTSTCVVTVTASEGYTPISTVISAVADLANKTPTAEEYTIKGTVTGFIGNSFFIQQGAYGMYVYNKPIEGNAVGKVVRVTATFQRFNGQYETAAISSAEILDEPGEKITPVVISSLSQLNNSMQNSMITLTGLTYYSGPESYTPSSDQSYVFTLANGTERITFRTSKYNTTAIKTAIGTKIAAAQQEGAIANFVGVHYVVYNNGTTDSPQINVCTADKIVVGTTDKELVQSFVDNYMHMNDYDPTLSGEGNKFMLR